MDKPVVEVKVTGIFYIGVGQGPSGSVNIILETEGAQDIALILPPQVVALLEARLQSVREELAARTALQ